MISHSISTKRAIVRRERTHSVLTNHSCSFTQPSVSQKYGLQKVQRVTLHVRANPLDVLAKKCKKKVQRQRRLSCYTVKPRPRYSTGCFGSLGVRPGTLPVGRVHLSFQWPKSLVTNRTVVPTWVSPARSSKCLSVSRSELPQLLCVSWII